jgi:transcriptional regulator with XRE-family HTH domain
MNPESIYRHIGEVIRNRRRSSKPRLTQETLAQRVGISRASLANIETGRQSVLVHQLYALAAVLKLDPSDFLPPANDAAARAEWNEVLPADLNSAQKDQIARLLADTQAEPTREEEPSRAKQAKR